MSKKLNIYEKWHQLSIMSFFLFKMVIKVLIILMVDNNLIWIIILLVFFLYDHFISDEKTHGRKKNEKNISNARGF